MSIQSCGSGGGVLRDRYATPIHTERHLFIVAIAILVYKNGNDEGVVEKIERLI